MKNLLVLQHIAREKPSNIAHYASDKNVGLDVIRLYETTHIPDPLQYDGVIVLGGPMGVYDEYAGKTEEIETLRVALGAVPTLGICLGAQLIAHVLGSRVYPHERDGVHIKEVGYYTVAHTDEGSESALFSGLPSPMTVLEWHGDTFDMPKGAKQLARSELCEHQAFSHNGAHGLQFHLEATPHLVEEWLSADVDWASDGFNLDSEKILRESHEHAPLMKAQCYRLLDNFLESPV